MINFMEEGLLIQKKMQDAVVGDRIHPVKFKLERQHRALIVHTPACGGEINVAGPFNKEEYYSFLVEHGFQGSMPSLLSGEQKSTVLVVSSGVEFFADKRWNAASEWVCTAIAWMVASKFFGVEMPFKWAMGISISDRAVESMKRWRIFNSLNFWTRFIKKELLNDAFEGAERNIRQEWRFLTADWWTRDWEPMAYWFNGDEMKMLTFYGEVAFEHHLGCPELKGMNLSEFIPTITDEEMGAALAKSRKPCNLPMYRTVGDLSNLELLKNYFDSIMDLIRVKALASKEAEAKEKAQGMNNEDEKPEKPDNAESTDAPYVPRWELAANEAESASE